MKRFWIGICVLAVLLTAGWITTAAIARRFTPIAQDLRNASQAASSGDWALAVLLSESAEEKWQLCKDFTAAFADHSVLEEIEAQFSQVRIFRQTGAQLSFTATCAHLSCLADAVAQSHLPKWQNLL